MTAKRKPTTAATRERRKHQVLRAKLWERIEDLLFAVQGHQGPGTQDYRAPDNVRVSEARFLIKALRDTGAK